MNRGRGRRESGQALAEFALVLPIFALMLFGFIEMARYVFVTNTANQAAREAARVVAVGGWAFQCPTAADRTECVKQIVASRLTGTAAPTASGDWTIDCFDPSDTARGGLANCRNGDYVLVRFQLSAFAFFTPIVAQVIPPPQVEGLARVSFNS